MEILISIASKIAEYSVAPVGQWLCYSFQYDNNIKNMTDQVNNLRATRDGMQNRVKAAENNVENIAADVDLWLKKVDDIMEKAKEVLEADEEKKNSSQGACLNWKLRHKHSKTAKKMLLEIDKLLKNVNFDHFSQRPASQDLVTSTYMDYMTFNSRISIMKDIMVALGDADINLIGVWGMPGVGKSTLVKEVAKKVKEEKLFDEVAISIVKPNSSLEKIQTEITETLDLRLDKETLGERARLLNARLTKDNNKKRLVILDDIWEKLDLEKIGIPPKGCKVVVTSRNKDILTSQMGTQKDFGLHILPKEEAWSLFEKMSGNSLKDSNLRSKAVEVSTACEGLPLALVTVATTLKNKHFPEWEDALQQLKSPNSEGVMYSAIELSYNYLESQELQPFFLLCAQIGSRISYAYLLKRCFGLRLFHGINTLEKTRNRIYTLLRSLKDSGLLLDGPDISKYVRMHDRVLDAALSIASKRYVLTMRDEGPVEWPNEDDKKICTSICVEQVDINEFPENLNFPELISFYVYPKDRDLSFKIPDTFFKGMKKLKVLDLTYMQLSSLPSSLMLLTNLKTLCLDQCVLGDIAMIGEMKNLEILSLSHSEFKQLPREIGFLTHLRMLDLSECKKLQVIPANVLSCLIQLEELFVGNSFTQWEVEGLNNERASLAELKHLSRLTTLEVHIPDANMLPKDLSFEKLQRYKIFVGDVWDWSDKHKNSRALKLKLNTSFHLERGIKMLLNGIENLCLDELKGVKSVIDEFDMTGFQQLKHLHVQNNVEIEYIINSRGMIISDVFFPVLEMLSLKNMINLEEICHGQIPSASFRNLSIMKVEHCEKLKFIFSSAIAKGLPQLQELVIQECSIMGAIIIKEEGEIEDTDMILFPQLRHLELCQLPKLVSFLNTQKSVINDAGEIIPEWELDFHMPILQEQVVFPNLETLALSSIHSEEILLHNQHRPSSSFKLTNIQTDSRFHNLCNLIVKGSGNLKYLLSSSTVRFMVQLISLYIKDCKVMEEILHIDEEEILSDALFPRLEFFVLEDLPIVKRFCIDSNVEFPSLKRCRIKNCPKLKTCAFKHASSNMEIVFANLESLEQSLIDLEEKQQNQHWARSFCKIKNMQTSIRFQNLLFLGVWGSDSFKYLLSSSIARSMVQVKYLHIVNCKAMEEILFIEDLGDEEEEEEEEEIIPKLMFPRLEVLKLNDLPILKRFCVGGNIEFKSMRSLIIEHCPKLKTFISKPSNSDTVMTVCKEIKEMNTEEIPRTVAIHPLFSEEVAFPNLEDLEISYVDDLKIIWDNQVPPYSFCKLQTMKVEFCENLMNIFQSDVLTRFRSLENVTITDCGSLQEVFQLQEQDAKETHDATVIPLKELRLDRVPKLKYVWNKDPQGIFNFPNLNLDSTGLRSYWSDSVPSD
ncbi:putative disease resistance protein At4g27220 isoform X2 [Castanea sativa]|uniref:putative disease resistance protein At4g27220 isoform X2 n=1 Tax=Castanea sativa TaxID=21020 RepID=UPI003F6518BF